MDLSQHPQQEQQQQHGFSHRERLTRFYMFHCPEKLSQGDVVLNRFQGKEETLFAMLIQKYGPEPSELWSPPQHLTLLMRHPSFFKKRGDPLAQHNDGALKKCEEEQNKNSSRRSYHQPTDYQEVGCVGTLYAPQGTCVGHDTRYAKYGSRAIGKVNNSNDGDYHYDYSLHHKLWPYNSWTGVGVDR